MTLAPNRYICGYEPKITVPPRYGRIAGNLLLAVIRWRTVGASVEALRRPSAA